jgi:hypothetical protein
MKKNDAFMPTRVMTIIMGQANLFIIDLIFF